MSSDYEVRKRLTFEQAEGTEPLPTQLQANQISAELRARLWETVYNSILTARTRDGGELVKPWNILFYRKYVYRDHRPVDEFVNRARSLIDEVKAIFTRSYYVEIFGFIQWVLREDACPPDLANQVESVLRRCRAAYAVFEGNTIVPIGSDAERETLTRAFADVAASEFHGPRAHLRNAGSALTAGDYPASVRESIHAVESVARVLEPSARNLAPALAKLEKSVRIHHNLQVGFSQLYNFTSDEKGIRHPLLDKPGAEVDETDALYMLGSCAAFVSYLINKARQAGLL